MKLSFCPEWQSVALAELLEVGELEELEVEEPAVALVVAILVGVVVVE